jgi:cephalosporin hydroxylase
LKTLAATISVVCKVDSALVTHYIDEIKENKEIQSRVLSLWLGNPLLRDATYGLARRVGWYAIVRITKPELIIETGIHQGVGAIVICEALRRNSREGFNGEYIGTDINPDAGKLLNEKDLLVEKILFGDSIESLKKLSRPVDILINDSDHDPEYEMLEYETLTPFLKGSSIILGDNSHVSSKLLEYSTSHNRNYLFFQEKPRDHWYLGAGIGISFPKNQ